MPRYVAFLRGINLGKRRLPMNQLQALFQQLKFSAVETFIASGNVLFTSAQADAAALETKIAAHLEKSLGYDVDTFVRTAEETVQIARAKIFPEDGQDGITLHAVLLHAPLTPEVARRLMAVRTETDEFRVVGCEYYWLCRIRTSDSKVWTRPEVKALKLPNGTMRNLTSLRKLVAKHLE